MPINNIEKLIENWPLMGNIKYAEAVEGPCSPEEELRDDGSRAVRTYYVEWHERIDFAKQILGYPELKGNGGGRYLSRKLPHSHPEYLTADGKPYMYATQIMRMEPWGFPDEMEDGKRRMRSGVGKKAVAIYGLAKVQVLYETLPYEVRGDNEVLHSNQTGEISEEFLERYVIKQVRPLGEAVSLPKSGAVYVDGGSRNVVAGFPSRVQIPIDFVVTWMQVPTLAIGMRLVNPMGPTWPIDDALGKINSHNFANCQYGTLLLEGASPTPIRGALGDRLWNVEFRFKYFGGLGSKVKKADGTISTTEFVTHQHVLRKLPDDNEIVYCEVSFDNADPAPSNLDTKTPGKSPYDYYDFRRLLRPPGDV